MRNNILTALIFLFFINNDLYSTSITGKITDNKNKPLSEANIYFKHHPKIGTTTDNNGVYKILLKSIDKYPDTLIFSFTGLFFAR